MKHAVFLLILIVLLAGGWFAYQWSTKRANRRRND
jgi:hypothetical protein